MKWFDIYKYIFLLLGCAVVLTLASNGIAQNQLPSIGAMGDSLTDEYQTDEYLFGLCWVEQLVKSRGFDFGAFSSISRGEPRRSGYEYNWARWGAKATSNYSYDLPSQWAGLANQVIDGKVTYVYLGIGNNDFGPAGNYDIIAQGILAGNDLEAFIDNIVGQIKVALDEVNSTGDLRLILGNITDNGVTPPTQQKYSVGQRDRVTDAVIRANTKIRAIANQRMIPVIDVFGLANLSLQDSLIIGNISINPRGAGGNPHNFLLSDGAHPGTVVQGLLANAFIEAIDRAYHADIEPLSDQEILANAGITEPDPGAAPTYFDISGFVLDPTDPPSPRSDFNDDGIVDAVDMCIMIDHWGEDYSLCDISLMPWGDGIVDIQDLIILAEHLFEVTSLPFDLAAYWRFDEEEGDIASNSIGDNVGLLFGGPVWRASEGKRDGALEFDGIDDHIITDFVLDPSDGTFSVFAWIKGGAPGQVIISQSDDIGAGETWLGIDALGGNLMTGLVPPPVGRFRPMPLESEFVINNGQWHHIGFVLHGSYRYLYVDGTKVVTDNDAQNPLKSANGGLYIGADKTLRTGTFFCGLIDDIRIYNVALSAEEIAALAQ